MGKRKTSTSDQVKDILNNIAPDDDDEEDEPKVQKTEAYQKRKSMGRPRAKSKGDELLEMLDNVDHNVDDANTTKDDKEKERRPTSTKSKRPTSKDKQRRPSDQVKDILNNIAPDDEDDVKNNSSKRPKREY